MGHPALDVVSHRPWPLPPSRWTWRQTWCDLLFAHWPIASAAVRALVPAPLEIDEHSGSTWVGVVPFRMEGVMLRPLPNLPYVSAFPEMNLRLYVRHGDRPGVWFISLDATNALAVWAARTFFHLPYFRAAMETNDDGVRVSYSSTRRNSPSAVRFRGSYRPAGQVYRSTAGSLDQFLTERYCLYAQRRDGAILRTEVHHAPWPLQPAEAVIDENTVAVAQGIPVSGPPALLHFARRLDVVVFPAERVA